MKLLIHKLRCLSLALLFLGDFGANEIIAQGFQLHEDILGEKIEQLELGNFDNDSLKDIVYFSSQSIGLAYNIGTDFNNVLGTEIYQSPNPIQQIFVVDANQDGFDDVFALEKDYGALIYLENDNNGGFDDATWIKTCEVAEFRALDMDGDGDLDILGSTQSPEYVNQQLLLFVQNDDASFETITLFSEEFYFVSDNILTVDIDNDGDLDILYYPYLAFGPVNTGTGALLLYTQHTDNNYSTDTLVGSEFPLADIQVADMNQDDRLDIIYANGRNNTGFENLFIAFQNDDSSFDIENISPDEQSFNRDNVGVKLLDINQDGLLDVFYRVKGIQVAINQGDKTFVSQKLIDDEPSNEKYTREFELVDFDNDGMEDLLATFNKTGKLEMGFFPLVNDPKEWHWYKMTDREQLTFEDKGTIFKEGDEEYSLWHISDLDENGYLDVIADGEVPFIFENINMSTSTVNSASDEGHINIYPNPSSDFISIDFNGENVEKLIIYNIHGQEIKRIKGKDDLRSRIDIRDISIGEYYLEYYDSKGIKLGIKPFVKI